MQINKSMIFSKIFVRIMQNLEPSSVTRNQHFLLDQSTAHLKTKYIKKLYKYLVVNEFYPSFIFSTSFFISCFEEFFRLRGRGGIMISCLLFIASLVNSNVVYMCCWKDILMLAAWYDHFQYSSDNNLSQNFGFVSASQLLPLVCLCGQGKWIWQFLKVQNLNFWIAWAKSKLQW